MRHGFISVALAFLVTSCVAYEKQGADSVLRAAYQRYVALLDQANYPAALSALSARNIADFDAHGGNSDFRSFFPVISSINQQLVQTLHSFERLVGDKGCLTVTGLDVTHSPTSMNLAFLQQKGIWKLDFVQIVYHASQDEQPLTATCPERP